MIGLEYICKAYQVQFKDVAKMIGVSPGTFNDWLSRRRNIPEQRLEQLSGLEIFRGIPKEYFQKVLEQYEKLNLDGIRTINEYNLIKKEEKYIHSNGELDGVTDAVEHNEAHVNFLKAIKRLQDTSYNNWGRDHQEHMESMAYNIEIVNLFAEILESKKLFNTFLKKVLYSILIYSNERKGTTNHYKFEDDSLVLQLIKDYKKHNKLEQNIIDTSIPIDKASHWIPLDNRHYEKFITIGKEYEIFYSKMRDEFFMIDNQGNNSTWFIGIQGYCIRKDK